MFCSLKHAIRSLLSVLLVMAEKSYIHKPAIRPMEYRTLAQLYDYHTVLHPQKEAFVIYDNHDQPQRSVYTFQEVKDKSVEIAGLLLHIGITRGQRVALMAPNCIEFAWCFLALNRIGANAILIPMYGKREEDVGTTIQRLKCQAFLMFPSGDSAYDHKLLAIVDKIIDKRKIVNIGPEKDDLFVINLKSLLGTTKLDESEVHKQQDKVQFDDHAVALFTSGSTGEPKAVQYTNHAVTNESFTHGMYCFDLVAMDSAQSKSIETRIFNDRPFSYAACFFASFNLVFAMGCTLVTIPSKTSVKKGQTEFILRVLQDEKCTHGYLMPYVIHDVTSSQSTKNFDLGNLKVIATFGQPIPKEHFSQLQNILPNCVLKNHYAMSEVIMAIKTFDDKSADAYDSMNVFPSTELKIVNDKKDVVAVGQKGEICVRSRVSFCGYLEDPKAEMRDIDTHGWIHTDDAGYIDDQGGLHVCGRMHEVITRAIDKIYPVEVERVLSLYPDIKAVAVVGVPDDRLYEEICACVIPKLGSELGSSITEFDQWASSQWEADDLGLTRKQRYTLVFKEFPATKTGKIDRKTLKALAVEKLGLN